MKWTRFWITPGDLAKYTDAVSASIRAINFKVAVDTQITKKDLYRAAVLAGLLARAGVVGGPEHNRDILEATEKWFKDI